MSLTNVTTEANLQQADTFEDSLISKQSCQHCCNTNYRKGTEISAGVLTNFE